MAAPMKMVTGRMFQIFNKSALNYRKSCISCITNWNKDIFSSQYRCCHVQMTLGTNHLAKNNEICRDRKLKGGNCVSTQPSRSVCSFCIFNRRDKSKPVIHTRCLKRHYVIPSEINFGKHKQEDSHLKSGNSQENVKEVKENICTVPNMLTMSRIALTPVIGYLVVDESFSLALGLCAFASITDLLDGYIARNFKNQMSALGTILDPLADKILVTVLTVTLTTAQLLPVPLAMVIIGRDVLLVAAGFVIRYISLPPPKTFKRYIDVTSPSAKLLPSTLSKINTTFQLSLVCLTLAAPVFGFVDHLVLKCLWGLTATTTVGSGIDYVINRKKSVQFLHSDSETKIK